MTFQYSREMSRVYPLQSNKTGLRLRVRGSATTNDEVLQALTARTNQITMEPVLDSEAVGDLFMNLPCDFQDQSLGLRDRGLGAVEDDIRDIPIV